MAKYSSISAQTLSLQGNLGSWNCPWEIIVFSFLHLRAVNLVGLLKGQCLPQRYVIFNSLIFKLYGPPYDCIKIQKSQKKKKKIQKSLGLKRCFWENQNLGILSSLWTGNVLSLLWWWWCGSLLYFWMLDSSENFLLVVFLQKINSISFRPT